MRKDKKDLLFFWDMVGPTSPAVDGGSAYDEKLLATSPLAYFPLDEASGNVASLVGGYTATVTGGSWLYGLTDPEGRAGAMDSQNNTGHYITADATLPADIGDNLGTMMMWVNFPTAGDYDANGNTIYHIDDTGGPALIRLVRQGGGSNFVMQHGTAGPDSISYDNSSATGWHNWTITWNQAAGDMRLYFDGVERDSKLDGISSLALNRFRFAGDTSARNANGPVAKLAIWTSELDPSVISDLATI